MASAQILHVDDDADIRLLMAASLPEFGYTVVTAGTVAEALKLASEVRFDLFILDVRLPDGTGPELAGQLRELQPGVPVVYYSGYTADAELRESLDETGDAYLVKPVSVEQLEQTVASLLERSRA